MNKLAVNLSKFVRSDYAYDRLRYCKSCGSYTCLRLDCCSACGARRTALPLSEYAELLAHRSRRIELFLAVSVVMLAITASATLLQLILSILLGGVGLYLLARLERKYRPFTESRLLRKLLHKDTSAIYKGLQLDLEAARKDTQQARYKEAYEKLREIGVFLHHDSVKIRKIMCLNHLIIRKDMDLELETLVPLEFDKDFIQYLRQAVLLNKQLVRERVLKYILIYRADIEAMEGGREAIVLVLGAALRMKRYILLCQFILEDYAEELPRERFLRLCKLTASDGTLINSPLYLKCREAARIRYGFDPDFHGIF